MYRILTPVRSIIRHKTRYLIFGLLILLLLLLSVGARAVGGAAAAQTENVLKRYAGTFCFYDAMKPHGVRAEVESAVELLPYVEHVDWVAMHMMNRSPETRLIGCEPALLEVTHMDGRFYEADDECVINEDYANYLFETSEWAGLGDSITVYDLENTVGGYYNNKTETYQIPNRMYSITLKVVGIVPNDGTIFASGVHFSNYQIYTTIAAVQDSYTDIDKWLYRDTSTAAKYYAPRNKISYFHVSIDQTMVKISDDETHWIFKDLYTRRDVLFSEAEILFSEAPPNEGYFCFVRIDDPANAQAFRDVACGLYTGLSTTGSVVDENGNNPYRQVVIEDGEEVVYWKMAACQERWYAAYLIADPASLVESLAPIAPLCDSIAKAATAATVILILLMTILLVHDRQYEIGVLRCMGVTSGGVCARFVAEILVFLVIVAAISLAVAVPAARLAANYLGLGGALGSVFATAVPQLALIAAATVVSCVLAAVMILQKKPMEILNSRT